MEQSPSWEANRFSVGQEIPRMLLNPKVHYRIHKCPPTVPILSHLNPIHTPISYFQKIHFNIILPSTSRSPKWSLSLRTEYTSVLCVAVIYCDYIEIQCSRFRSTFLRFKCQLKREIRLAISIIIISIIVIIMYVSSSWTTCWSVLVSHIQQSLQWPSLILSVFWFVVFYYPW